MTHYPLQLTCLGVIWGTPLLATIFVALRIYTRRKLNLRLGWDDWLIIVPLLLSLALIGPSHRHVKMWHVGIHVWEVPWDKLEPNYDEWYGVNMAFNLLNIPILPLVKASIILLLLRAGSVIEWLKRVLYAILVFTVGSALIPWFLFIFTCPPLTGNTWKLRTFGGLHCMGKHASGEMLIWVTCANLLTDCLILPIPFVIVRRMMSARLRSRLVVLAVFTCSLAVTAIGAAKIYLSYRDRLFSLYKPDWTYPIDYCINHIENNVAIIVANIPILRGLVTRWVFNFRTKATPMEREFRGDWQWNSSNSSVGSNMEGTTYPSSPSKSPRKTEHDVHAQQHSAPRRARHQHNRLVQKIFPCVQDDFSSSLATRSRSDVRHGARHARHEPPRLVSPAAAQHADGRKRTSYFPRFQQSCPNSRRNSTAPNNKKPQTSTTEKGDMLETIRSVNSLGSAPTLVESKDYSSWKHRGSDAHTTLSTLTTPPHSPTTRSSMGMFDRRFSAATLTSPITAPQPARLRGIADDSEEDDDEIYTEKDIEKHAGIAGSTTEQTRSEGVSSRTETRAESRSESQRRRGDLEEAREEEEDEDEIYPYPYTTYAYSSKM